MPGLKKSPGMADIDVCFGAHKAGSEGVQRSLRKTRVVGEHDRNVGALDLKRFSDVVPSAEDDAAAVVGGAKGTVALNKASSGIDELSGDDVASGEDSGIAASRLSRPFSGAVEGFEEEHTIEGANAVALEPGLEADEVHSSDTEEPTKMTSFASFGTDESRLPPTPPMQNDSSGDGEESRTEGTVSPAALTGESTNGLSSKISARPTTPVNQPANPPTPDPSPPRKSPLSPSRSTQREISFPAPVPEILHADDVIQPAAPVAHQETALQDSRALTPNVNMSPVHLSAGDTLPVHWLDTTRDLQAANDALEDIQIEQTPRTTSDSDHPRSLRAAKRNISSPLPNGLGIVNSLGKSQSAKQSVEQRNNVVYKRLQEENMKRHSTVSAASGAIVVGIAIPSSNESTPKSLRRQHKHSSLRLSVTPESTPRTRHASEGAYPLPRHAIEGHRERVASAGRTLKTREARAADKNSMLDDTPLLERSAAIFPSLFGQDDSPTAGRLTRHPRERSPTARRVVTSPSDPIPKLRHTSDEQRLSNNPSVRRTNREISPESNDHAFHASSLSTRKVRRASGENPVVIRKQPENRDILVHQSKRDSAQPKAPLNKEPPTTPVQDETTTTRTNPHTRSLSSPHNLPRRPTTNPPTPPQIRHTSLNLPFTSPPPSAFSPTFPRSSFDKGPATASPRKSIDARHFHPTTTPMSFSSQLSDRTADIEIGEANGVRLYPHTNNSLLLIRDSSRPASNAKDEAEAPNFFPPSLGSISRVPDRARGSGSGSEIRDENRPTFAARLEPPTPTLSVRVQRRTDGYDEVDSPLTNPRIAPEPPVIKFIPPTPEREILEQQGGSRPRLALGPAPALPEVPVRRRGSMLERARRVSEVVFPNLSGSLRGRRGDDEGLRFAPLERDTHLSPLWRPLGFWDEFDSDSEEDEYYASSNAHGDYGSRLPRGGDTSSPPPCPNDSDSADQTKGSAFFPRALSKRLPGFRGTGGFLLGNSLGIERHGSNNRRHYVSTSTRTRTLSKRQSQILRRNGDFDGEDSGAPDGKRHFVVPFSGGTRAYWVGSARFRDRVRGWRAAREERRREVRRERIRRSIGVRTYDGNQSGL